MNSYRLVKRIARRTFLPLLFCLLAVGLVACGNASTSTGSSQAQTAASATSCAQATTATRTRGNATGPIQSVQGSTFVVATTRNGNVQVTFSSSTRISRTQSVALSALQEGQTVTLQVKQEPDGNYTATVINVTNRTGLNGQPFGNGNGTGRRGSGTASASPCTPTAGQRTFGGGQFGGGQFGGGQFSGTPSAAGTRAVIGTLGQINGNSLTVTDFQNNDYTVNVDSTTRISQTVTGTASDLTVGANVTVTGTPGTTKGTITAQSITIIPAGFRPTATPTQAASS